MSTDARRRLAVAMDTTARVAGTVAIVAYGAHLRVRLELERARWRREARGRRR